MDDGQEARWESIGCPMVRGSNALAVSRFTDKPKLSGPSKLARPMGIEPTSPRNNPGVLSRLNYGTVRESAQTSSADRGCGFLAVLGRVRWASGVIERRHSMPGIEPGPPRAFATDGTPSLWCLPRRPFPPEWLRQISASLKTRRRWRDTNLGDHFSPSP